MSGHKSFKVLSDKLRSTLEGRIAVEQEQQIVRALLAPSDQTITLDIPAVEQPDQQIA